MKELIINTTLTRQILVGFIESEIKRVGFQRAVIGLSGGIDSALSCFLTAEALGPENVLAVRMPYKGSSPESLEHAQLVIEATGIQAITIPITEMVEPAVCALSRNQQHAKGQHHGPQPNDSALRSIGSLQRTCGRYGQQDRNLTGLQHTLW